VHLASNVFESLAKAGAAALGSGDLPILVVPHPFGVRPKAEVEDLAVEKAREFVHVLDSLRTDRQG
jgi:hypothetical protein